MTFAVHLRTIYTVFDEEGIFFVWQGSVQIFDEQKQEIKEAFELFDTVGSRKKEIVRKGFEPFYGSGACMFAGCS